MIQYGYSKSETEEHSSDRRYVFTLLLDSSLDLVSLRIK
jgi:hypothetical protein